jgi:hypothetical protein
MRTFIAALLVVSTALAQTPTKTPPQQGPPPKNLTVRSDGHVTANEDPANPDKFEVHVVKQGETLSGIAGEVLKNPRMWPQLWEQNEHIINPHWIYPSDKILIRPLTEINAAKPPEPAPESVTAAAPAETADAGPARSPASAPANRAGGTAAAAAAAAADKDQNIFDFGSQKPVSEVKFDDLYCSGFVRDAPLPRNLKVISKFDAASGVLANEADYVYLSQGSEEGVKVGDLYQVIRPTKMLTNPFGRTKGTSELGRHYLDVAQLKVMLTQPDFALARVMHSCGDSVEVGDVMIPFQQIVLPALPRPRSFNPQMITTSGVKGMIVSNKDVLLNFGSAFKMSGEAAGVAGTDRLGLMTRGIASAGSIVYIDIGQTKGVQPGDVFIVYRTIDLDERLTRLPEEARKLRGTRTAIGELIVVKTGERASTAVVTYASDALALGDSVERR